MFEGFGVVVVSEAEAVVAVVGFELLVELL